MCEYRKRGCLRGVFVRLTSVALAKNIYFQRVEENLCLYWKRHDVRMSEMGLFEGVRSLDEGGLSGEYLFIFSTGKKSCF